MKKRFILITFVCSTAICSNIYAQRETPPGAGDKDLRDNNIKSRSVDLERVDRDARKTDKSAIKNSAAETEAKLAAKYAEIKTDFEQIQLSQDVVVKTYQRSVKIDYVQISKSALEINKSALRLNSNLFPAPPVENTGAKKQVKKEDKTEKEPKQAKSVRDLIVDLDNTIGSFAASTMFQNLRVIDTAVSEKAKLDLGKIIELSALLSAEALIMAKIGK